MQLKDRIREAIEGSGKSKADVARDCEVTNAAVTHWLNGDTKSLKAEIALGLEASTGYRARWILHGKGQKRVDDPYWPFSVPLARFQGLTDKGKGFVEYAVQKAIEEWEAKSSGQTDADILETKSDSLVIATPRKDRGHKRNP
jgi:transcriptional regulator with XRE-family HTH domain